MKDLQKNHLIIICVGISCMVILGMFINNEKPIISQQEIYTPDSNKNTSTLTSSSSQLIDRTRIVYTKVDKCGSTFVKYVLERLASRRRDLYRMGNAQKYLFYKMNNSSSTYYKSYMERFMNKSGNTLTKIIDFHTLYFDFNELDEPRWPFLFSLVRNPLDKFISRFYYHKENSKHRKLFREYTRYSLEECIDKKYDRCDFSTNARYTFLGDARDQHRHIVGTISYFCGFQEECRFIYTETALQLAKQHIEEHYQVVGITEEMDAFFELLEKEHPALHGILQISRKPTEVRNKGPERKPLEKKYIDYLRNGLKLEFDLYYFIKGRMCKQYKKHFPWKQPLQACL